MYKTIFQLRLSMLLKSRSIPFKISISLSYHGIHHFWAQWNRQIQISSIFNHPRKYNIKSCWFLYGFISDWCRIQLNKLETWIFFLTVIIPWIFQKLNSNKKNFKKIWPLFICLSPAPHFFNARILARVDDNTSFLRDWWSWLSSPQDPSSCWFSNNHFTHCGNSGELWELGDGTIATQLVSYAETEISTFSNVFLIFSFVCSKLWTV